MSKWSQYTAEDFENGIADAIKDKNLEAAVSLLRIMAVEHPHRAEIVLNRVEFTLDLLAESR